MHGGMKNGDCRPVSRFISEMMQYRAIVTTEGEYETAPKLSNGTSLNDREWPPTQISRSQYYSTSNNTKTVQYLQYVVYRTAPFPMTERLLPRVQGHAIFDAEYLRNAAWHRRSFNGILIGTYTRPTQQCHFEWPWMTYTIFNDTKHSAASLRQLSFLSTFSARRALNVENCTNCRKTANDDGQKYSQFGLPLIIGFMNVVVVMLLLRLGESTQTAATVTTMY